MKKVFFWGLILFSCLLLVTGCGQSGSSGGSSAPRLAGLEGRVLAPGDIPVPDALVILGDESWVTQTDENGNFSFNSLPPGTYPLQIINDDDYFLEDTLTLAAGANTTTQTLVIDPGTEDPELDDIDVNPKTGLPQTPFNVSADVVDRSGSGIKEVRLVEVNTGQVVPMSGPQGGGTYTASLDAPAQAGDYKYQLFAVDNAGHLKNDKTSVEFNVDAQATIRGTVTKAAGGEPVAGAAITCPGTTYTTTTAADGTYSFNVPAGQRTIVSQKTGFSDSRFLDLTLAENQTYTVNLIQYPIFNSSWTVGPITLNITGVTEGQEISDPVTISITATGANPIQKIQLWTGNEGNLADYVSSDQSTLSCTWNPQGSSAQGNTYIYATAQDVNYNWCARRINLQVVNPGTYTLGRVNNFVAYANTYAENLEAYEKDASTLFTMPNGRQFDLKAAPAGCMIFSNLYWKALSGVNGYRIWRKIDDGSYQVIASLTSGEESYIDADPSLTPGQTLSYQIQAFRGTSYGQYTAAPATTILDKFTVNLTAPANQSTGISLTPTFTWSVNSDIGTSRLFKLYLWRKNDDSIVINGYTLYNGTSQKSPVILENTKVYEWDLFAAAMGSWSYARKEYTAFSYPKKQSTYSPANSSNGGFIFTTTP